MKQNLSLLFIIGFLFLISCKDTSTKEDVVFAHEVEMDIFNIKDSCYLSEFIKEGDFVKLQLPSDYFFGIISDVLFHNEDIIVVDRKQSRVFRFDKDGQFLNLIGSRGNGPEEYLSISQVILLDDNIGVCDVSSRKINVYDSKGEFVKRIHVPSIYRHISPIPDEKFVCYTPDYVDDENFGIWTINQMGEKENEIYKFPYIYPTYGTDWNSFFYLGESKIGISNTFLLEFYLFDTENNQLSNWLKIKSNSKILGDFVGVESTFNLKEKFINLMRFSFSDNYGFFLWSFTNDDSNRKSIAYSIYDIQNNSINLYDNWICDLKGYYTLAEVVNSNLKNRIVSVIPDYIVERCHPDDYKEGKLDEGSVIVQIFKMK